MVDNGYNILDCHMDGDTIILHDKKRDNFIEFQKKFESVPRIKRVIERDTELEILNGQLLIADGK